mgnify:CR=1 FL=1
MSPRSPTIMSLLTKRSRPAEQYTVIDDNIEDSLPCVLNPTSRRRVDEHEPAHQTPVLETANDVLAKELNRSEEVDVIENCDALEVALRSPTTDVLDVALRGLATDAQRDVVKRQIALFLPVAICRPLLFDAVRAIPVQPLCAVIATMCACWIATAAASASVPLRDAHEYKLFLNSKKIRMEKKHVLVVAHPIKTVLKLTTGVGAGVGAGFHINPIHPANVAKYFQKLTEKAAFLERWGWQSLCTALRSIQITEIEADKLSWVNACYGDGCVIISAMNGDSVRCHSRVRYIANVPPSGYVVTAPHAEAGQKAWSWPDFIETD